MWKKNAVKINGSLQYAVKIIRLFDCCENEDVVDLVKYTKIGVDTMLKYMELVKKEVYKKIEKEVPEKFAILIDGLSEAV